MFDYCSVFDSINILIVLYTQLLVRNLRTHWWTVVILIDILQEIWVPVRTRTNANRGHPSANNIATNLVAIYWQSESYIPKFTDFSFWSIFVLICFLPQLRQLPISASNFFSVGNFFYIKKVHRFAVWQETPYILTFSKLSLSWFD